MNPGSVDQHLPSDIGALRADLKKVTYRKKLENQAVKRALLKRSKQEALRCRMNSIRPEASDACKEAFECRLQTHGAPVVYHVPHQLDRQTTRSSTELSDTQERANRHDYRVHRFLAEWDVAGWITEMNKKSGLAPAVKDIRDELDVRLNDTFGLTPGEDAFRCKDSGQKSWVRRLKRKWHARTGIIPTTEPMADEILNKKVTIFLVCH